MSNKVNIKTISLASKMTVILSNKVQYKVDDYYNCITNTNIALFPPILINLKNSSRVIKNPNKERLIALWQIQQHIREYEQRTNNKSNRL